MSLLFWVEHCVECAAPECYQTCDLYQPRTDKRCRRFTYGAMKNRNFPSLRGYGVEISFKKWAKLEAYGNLSLLPVRTVLWGERIIQWAAPITDLVGRAMAKMTGKARWNGATLVALEELVRRLDGKKSDPSLPDAFVLEIYNPDTAPVRMQLSFAPVKPPNITCDTLLHLTPSFVTTLALPSGYSCHPIEMSILQSVTASGGPFVVSMIPEADNQARLVFLTADFVKFALKPATAREPKKIKCVVWDLDNTLWQGVLVEGDAVALRSEIVPLLTHLDKRGILLSVVSKNDHAVAWRKLEELGIAEYFVFPQINWAPKSQNIRKIADRLNIGIDALAFVDDSPFERDEVARTLPDVLCVRADEIPSLFADPRFQGSRSVEARRRRQFYREAAVREAARTEFGSDYTGFLAACGITLEIAPYAAEDSERVAELVQRTNQLNFSGCKYSRDKLEAILSDTSIEKFVLRSSDRYGSYGTVGFAIVEHAGEAIRIPDLMLSCRVQGKLLEQAFFSHILQHHNPRGSERLWVNYHETERNKPAQQALESMGFHPCVAEGDGKLAGMELYLREPLRCEFIQVCCSEPSLTVVPAYLPSIGSSKFQER